MTQSGRAKNTFFSVTLYNFQKGGRAIALPTPPPTQSLFCEFTGFSKVGRDGNFPDNFPKQKVSEVELTIGRKEKYPQQINFCFLLETCCT